MQNYQFTANRIKKRAKEMGSKVGDILKASGLNINTVSELSKGKIISYISLAKIAEQLNCSMDYLMGRTDNPDINL